MYSEDEDTEVKIYWGECNNFLLEQWMDSRKKIFNYVVDDYKPSSVEVPDKPWMIPGADVSDWFNFGFNEETWNDFLLKQISLRQHQILQKERDIQQEHLRSRESRTDSKEKVRRKEYKYDEHKKSRR
jgi:Fip1 motif